MNLLINSSITGLAFLLYSGLYIITTISKPQTDIRRVFRWYLLAMILWSLTAFLIYVDEPRSSFWFRMMVASQPGMMISIFAFARSNIKVKNKWDTVVLIFGILIIGFTLMTNLLVSSFRLENGIIYSDLTPYTYIPAIPGFAIIIYSLTSLIGLYRRSIDPIQQNRLLYIILGIGVMIIGSAINFTPFGKYPIGHHNCLCNLAVPALRYPRCNPSRIGLFHPNNNYRYHLLFDYHPVNKYFSCLLWRRNFPTLLSGGSGYCYGS